MNYFVVDSYEELSFRGAGLVMDQLKTNKRLLLGAATGGTPSGLYARLADFARETPSLFSTMRVFKLDEWMGLPMDDPGTCESYLRTKLLTPLGIDGDRYFTFNSNPSDPEEECSTIRDKLVEHGPIDLCILGLGMNGHIAFNEPGAFLFPNAHVSSLATSSQSHAMVAEHAVKPVSGLTLGMGDILRSRMILLLIGGPAKREITRRLMTQRITTSLPASLLWLHPNAICLMDRAAYE